MWNLFLPSEVRYTEEICEIYWYITRFVKRWRKLNADIGIAFIRICSTFPLPNGILSTLVLSTQQIHPFPLTSPNSESQQDTVSGFLLAGVGHRTANSTNFLIVKTDTKLQQVEEAFLNFSQRDDVGIILINQHIANDIRHVLKDYNQTIPTVLEIPSKEHPYDPEQDYIMQRVNMYLGGGN